MYSLPSYICVTWCYISWFWMKTHVLCLRFYLLQSFFDLVRLRAIRILSQSSSFPSTFLFILNCSFLIWTPFKLLVRRQICNFFLSAYPLKLSDFLSPSSSSMKSEVVSLLESHSCCERSLNSPNLVPIPIPLVDPSYSKLDYLSALSVCTMFMLWKSHRNWLILVSKYRSLISSCSSMYSTSTCINA